MKNQRQKTENREQRRERGFTIVELLTVMAIIAILIGLLVPALNLAMKYAKDTKQRAQFHSIAAALEMFKSDYGDYPPSTALAGAAGSTYSSGYNAYTAGNETTGAQMLTEALVGRDLQGFDPMSTWNAAADDPNKMIYASSIKNSDPCLQILPSQDRREGPYLTLQGVGVFCTDQLYGVAKATSSAIFSNASANQYAPFITDVYGTRSVTIGGKTVKAGTPVLYFKANSANKDLGIKSVRATNQRTYDYWDNGAVLALGNMMTGVAHPLYTNSGSAGTNTSITPNFYQTISNPQITNLNVEGIAYNPDTYILMSAGNDGLFGSRDDIYNFGQ